jgi:hypothetical protein
VLALKRAGTLFLLQQLSQQGTMESIQFEQDETGPNAPQQPTTPDPNRPAWLDPKFKSPEELARAYNEQQAAYTRQQQELARLKGTTPPADPTVKEPEQQDQQQSQQDDAAKKVAEAAGLDLTPYQQEYTSNGDVSEENRAKLADSLKSVLGPNARNIVDEYIEARKVVQQNDTRMFMDAAGGEESYQTMSEWARSNWSPEQIAVYNRQVESGDRHSALFAVESLRTQFEAANGRIPNRLSAVGSPSNAGSQPFRSAAEMTTAMKDPRYKSDPAYRDDVARRLAASNFT